LADRNKKKEKFPFSLMPFFLPTLSIKRLAMALKTTTFPPRERNSLNFNGEDKSKVHSTLPVLSLRACRI
jgi:hypothetical protein